LGDSNNNPEKKKRLFELIQGIITQTEEIDWNEKNDVCELMQIVFDKPEKLKPNLTTDDTPGLIYCAKVFLLKFLFEEAQKSPDLYNPQWFQFAVSRLNNDWRNLPTNQTQPRNSIWLKVSPARRQQILAVMERTESYEHTLWMVIKVFYALGTIGLGMALAATKGYLPISFLFPLVKYSLFPFAISAVLLVFDTSAVMMLPYLKRLPTEAFPIPELATIRPLIAILEKIHNVSATLTQDATTGEAQPLALRRFNIQA